MKRNDIHRPSAINPADYQFICCKYPDGDLETVRESMRIFREHMERHGAKFSGHEHGGSCYVCGASALYLATFYHAGTNTYIQTGLDCANKLEMGDEAEFRSFRKRIAEGLKTKAGRAKAQEFLALENLSAAWTVYTASTEAARINGWDSLGREEQTLQDIVYKLVRYGSLSKGQLEYVAKLLARIESRPAREAARAAEIAAAADVPVIEARVEFVGKVLSTKVQESQFGDTIKMLVQHETGYKVYGTVPSSLDVDGLKGSTVAFVARIARSDKDPKFGFFSRPSKARVVQKAVA